MSIFQEADGQMVRRRRIKELQGYHRLGSSVLKAVTCIFVTILLHAEHVERPGVRDWHVLKAEGKSLRTQPETWLLHYHHILSRIQGVHVRPDFEEENNLIKPYR